MKHTLRALIAVFLLVGAQLAVVGLTAAVALGVRGLVDDGHRGFGVFRLALFVLLLAVITCWSLTRAVLQRTSLPPGVPLRREDQPALWAEIDRLAAQVRTRAPDDVLLVEPAEAAVVEDARPLRRSRRTLLLGAPLVVGLDADEMRAVLAHELGHYSARHTRLSRFVHRGQIVLAELVVRMGPASLVGRLLRLYARVYLTVAGSVSRAQELEADRFAAEVAGVPATARAVVTVPQLAESWHFFRRSDVLFAEERGRRPERLFQVFGDQWRAPDSTLRARTPAAHSPVSPHDTHPDTATRLARLHRLPDGPQGPATDEPTTGETALDLLCRPDDTLGAVETLVYGGSGLVPTGWAELVAERAASEASGAARQLGWAAEKEGLTGHATVGALLDLVAAGQGPRLAGRFMDRGAPVLFKKRALVRLLRGTLEHAMVERHGLRHVPGRDGSPVLLGDDGTPCPPAGLVEAAVEDPESVPALRHWADRHGLLDVRRTLSEPTPT